jgi:hypothetical protein
VICPEPCDAKFNADQPLYFDYNSSTPISKEVADAMEPFLEWYGKYLLGLFRRLRFATLAVPELLFL